MASLSLLCTCQPAPSGCISKTSNMLWATDALISKCTHPAPFQRKTQHNNLLPPAALAPVCCSVATVSKPHNIAALTTDRRSYCELNTTAAAKEISMAAGFFLIWTGLCTSHSKKNKKTQKKHWQHFLWTSFRFGRRHATHCWDQWPATRWSRAANIVSCTKKENLSSNSLAALTCKLHYYDVIKSASVTDRRFTHSHAKSCMPFPNSVFDKLSSVGYFRSG